MIRSGTFLVLLAGIFGVVNGEQHTVRMLNHCGSGTPTLISQNGQILSTGADYTQNGPLVGARAYLQGNGVQCGFNGDHCSVVELTLQNVLPGKPGSGSSTDISLIPPLAFSSKIAFNYGKSCKGAECDDANCPMAFRISTDYSAQVQCETNDVGLTVSFC